MLVKNNSQRKIQKAWVLLSIVIVIAMLLGACSTAQTSKVYRVGILSGLDAFAPSVDGFKNKMTELGYIEGENITYDVQSTNVDFAAYQTITKKFVADKVDLIFVFPTEASMEAKTATQGTDIPVIFSLAFTDVPEVDLINSVREPGGNMTGVRFPSADIANKRLEILLEMVPTAKRIFIPFLKDYPNVPGQLEAMKTLAENQGIELIEFAAASPADLQAELDRRAALDDVGIDAILMIAEPLAITPVFYDLLGKFSYEHKIPIGGALMNVGADYASIFGLLPDAALTGAQAALLADKALKGTPAGTIPVVTSESYFRINYRAAQALGVTIPEGLLNQAVEIIR